MTVTTNQPKKTGKGTGTYNKGLARRETLLNAAADLLRTHDLDELSLKDIAEHASVPVGSAYHFFANANSVYAELAQRFALQLGEAIAQPYPAAALKSWQHLFGEAVNRAASLYRQNPAYRQLIIGGKAPPEIKLADRANDERVGVLMIELISTHFEFEDFPRSREVFFYLTEIVDLFFSLSVMRDGDITDKMIEEAKRAGEAYIGEYLPEGLKPRG